MTKRTCAGCDGECDRAGQRYCRRCHNESERRRRARVRSMWNQINMLTSLPAGVQAVVTAVRKYKLACGNERALQDALARVFARELIHAEREWIVAQQPAYVEGVPLRHVPSADRIDFRVRCGDDLSIGVEVKIAGSPSEVVRQLSRYASSGSFGHLVLVTTRARHEGMPETLHGIPLTVVRLEAQAFR